jgi:MFS family permease
MSAMPRIMKMFCSTFFHGQGSLGISGAILIQVYYASCKGKPSTYLLMLALLPTFVSLMLMFLVRIYKATADDDKKHLNGFSAVALAIAGYLMVIIILENIVTLPLWARICTFIFLLLLLASPLGIAIKALREDSKRSPQTYSTAKQITSPKLSTAEDPIEYHELPSGEGQVRATSDDEMLPDEEHLNPLQAMRTVNFWLLFLAMVCGMGSGLATINNMSQIGESLSYTTVEINNLVSLWSIWNFLGRFGAGYISDYLLHTRGWARPLLMVITLATMAAGHIVIASGFPGNLYLGSILVGICYGSQWSLMPTISSEIFGVRHMSTIFNIIAIANPVGSYIYSVRVIGYIYDEEASGEDDSCYGTRCFMLSFLIMASVAFLGFLVAVALFFRTRKFYQLAVLRRLKHSLR